MSAQPSLVLRLFGQLIHLYQETLSPDHGIVKGLFPHGVCRFTPTCSEYAFQAIDQRGWSGLVLAIKRVLRCHPFTAGGSDPVPRGKQ